MKTAKLANGEILQFPDETPQEVIDATVKRHMAGNMADRAGLGKAVNNQLLGFLGSSFEHFIELAVRRYLKNSKGEVGDTGPQGDCGEKGDQGEKGDRGDVGPEGKRGPRGEKGDQGRDGIQGPIGPIGPKGDRGERGEKGEKGDRGEKGEKGDRGNDGGMGPPGGRGRPGAFWRGVWTSGVAYNDYDAVYYQGSSYVCLAGNVTTPPPGLAWQLVAQKGQDGTGGGGGGSQVNSDWNATSGVAQILNKPSLSAVATSGAYSDLSGKPALATVATSGSYSDLSSKPTLGTAAAKDIPASGNASSTQVVYGTDTRLTDARTPTSHTHPLSELTQSGASTGQVPKWNGSAWVPGLVASIAGSTFTLSSDYSDTSINGSYGYDKISDRWIKGFAEVESYYFAWNASSQLWIFGYNDGTSDYPLLHTPAGITTYFFDEGTWHDNDDNSFTLTFSSIPPLPADIRIGPGSPGASSFAARADHTHGFQGTHLPMLSWDAGSSEAIARAGVHPDNKNFYMGGNLDKDGNQLFTGQNGCLLYFDTRTSFPNQTFTIYNFDDGGGGLIAAFAVSKDGAIKLASMASSPATPEAGQIYYNSSNGHFYGYNGSTWKQLDN